MSGRSPMLRALVEPLHGRQIRRYALLAGPVDAEFCADILYSVVPSELLLRRNSQADDLQPVPTAILSNDLCVEYLRVTPRRQGGGVR